MAMAMTMTMTMNYLYPFFFFTYLFFFLRFSSVSHSDSCLIRQYISHKNREFKQKIDKFWEYEEKSNTWIQVKLPYHLISCVNNTCTKVGSIHQREKDNYGPELKLTSIKAESEGNKYEALPFRKRVCLTRMSETSIWITGQSGSIYERYWNGLQWIVAPHDLPLMAGYAISVFVVNQTILALSQAGKLYQIQLNGTQPVWIEVKEQDVEEHKVSGVASNDRERMYFCTKSGSLLELSRTNPPRWKNHGRPPGANVAGIADATSFGQDLVFIISGAGDLYEFDPGSKPSWKKHIKKDGSPEDISFTPSHGCCISGLNGDFSLSLFLQTKGGKLVERQLRERKWRWIVHGSPTDHRLTSITCASHYEHNGNSDTLFLVTAAGFVFEYRIPKQSGANRVSSNPETWMNHFHPLNAKTAKGIKGLQLQLGRMIFALDDGRIAELHLPGIGGENSSPNDQVINRRKSSTKYIWSILDAPESEGWNAEYCTEEHGPTNCISGMNEGDVTRTLSRRRKGHNAHENYLPVSASGRSSSKILEDTSFSDQLISKNFRLRAMQGGQSFFFVTDDGLTFEYVNVQSMWFWMRHDHTISMKAAAANYNGSMFLIDEHGSLFIRERQGTELAWTNCTAMKRGKQVIGGPPWDGLIPKSTRSIADDALFFVSKTGRLLRFTVGWRKFKWKDCRSPVNTEIASIVDQESVRENIIFIIGSNGRLYQYNKITELWHEHYQSQHLILQKSPGTAMRSSLTSLKASLFMISEDGRLVEYHWNSLEDWKWIEHGTPDKNVKLVGSPGPCFGETQLFLIASNGDVYLRFLEKGTWKWKNIGFPLNQNEINLDQKSTEKMYTKKEICLNGESETTFQKIAENMQAVAKNCSPKVEKTRPIPFGENSVIFELTDGRLGELQQIEGAEWTWARIIGTPTSSCLENY